MRKTSVYLPDALKATLTEAAARAGVSEAEFIRRALEAAVHHRPQDRAQPNVPSRMRPGGPLLVGVGVGPGAPDLLTARARAIIQQADTIIAAAISADAIGRAEATVRAALGPLRVRRVPLDVTGSAAQRDASNQTFAARVVDYLDRGDVVVVLTLGDPSMFSAFPSLAARVRQIRPGVPIETVPGVMAFQELAARAGTVVGGEHQSVRIVAVQSDTNESAASIADTLAREDETLVLYRGGRCVASIADQLVAVGRADTAVVGELLGLPGERCAPVTEYVGESASYLATLIAPAPGPR